MNRVVLERRVRDDGVLQLTLPLGAERAGRDVQITVELLEPNRAMTSESWRAGILSTAGGWEGEFERPLQDVPEEREPLS